jgi:hypothetical protein
MASSKLFISSCSRRQLARRRPGHAQLRLQLLLMLLTLIAALAAFVAGRGGI